MNNPNIKNNIINIKIGELAVSKDKILSTIVGSCVACCIFDEKSKVIGMAHIMLPNSNNSINNDNNLKAKYADTAVKNLIQELARYGADTNNLKAKIVGGASIFTNENDEDMFNIGRKNIDKVKELLKQYNIKIVAEDTGGRNGRSVTFDPSTLNVRVKSSNYEKVI
jgi:Chemotaxis protein; stimulates methylation of MCP proteins